MKQLLMIAVFIGGMGMKNTHGQFLKNLKERALERSKEIVIEKTAEKAAEKTGQAMDKILNPKFNRSLQPMGNKVDMSKVPESYVFDYKYSLRMTTKQGSIDFDYYLSRTGPYMGVKMNMGMDMTMVFDEENKILFTYLNGIGSAVEMDVTDEGEDEDNREMLNDFTFKELPNRQFLGYDCIGREMENENYKFILYMAMDMEADFANMFKSEHANVPPHMQKYYRENQNGLMMYMEMTDKKNRNKKKKDTSGTMECIAFEPVDMVINTRDQTVFKGN